MAWPDDVDAAPRSGAAERRSGRQQTIVTRTAALALHRVPAPRRILDIGCGTGDLLRRLAAASPTAVALVGLDGHPANVTAAAAASTDDRLRYDVGQPEELRYADGTFDLVVSTTSFRRWADQAAGLAQCGRVLASGGQLVLADRFAPWSLVPCGGRARTRPRAEAMLAAAGFDAVQWYGVYGRAVRAVRAVTASAGRGEWPSASRSA